MKKNIKIKLLIIFQFVVLSLYSQEEKISKIDEVLYNGKLTNDDFFNKSDFIFEGEIFNTNNEYYNNDSSEKYVSVLVYVSEVYKGFEALNNGNVELILNFKKQDYNDLNIFNSSGKTIFFCKKSNFIKNPQKIKTNNNISLRLLTNEAFAGLFYSQLNSKFEIWGLNHLYFDSKNIFFNYLKKYKNIKLPSEQSNNFKNNIKPLVKNNTNNKLGNLNIELTNHTLTSTGNYYFYEFDITVSEAGQNTFLNSFFVKIKYNPLFFGANPLANGKMLVTLNDDFDSYSYYCSYTNEDPESFNIYLNQTPSSSTTFRTLLSTDKLNIIHVKVEIPLTANGLKPGLIFKDVTYTSTYSTYTNSINSPISNAITYSNTTYVNPPDNQIVFPIPKIYTDLSLIHVKAGLNDVLTINGENFGNNKGNIHFKNADNAGLNFIRTNNNSNIISWSNTKIELKIPSCISNLVSSSFNVPGNGQILIQRSDGGILQTEKSLHIDYAIEDFVDLKYGYGNVFLSKNKCIDGYVFTLHNAFRSLPQAITCIEKALNEWSIRTGLKLTLEKDFLGNYVFESTINLAKNLIYFEAGNYAMAVVGKYFYCKVNNGENAYFRLKAPIRINPTPNFSWDYNISGTTPIRSFSFYQAFLHEIGHVIGLGHVIDKTALMHSHGNANHPNNIITLLNSTSSPMDAANAMINESKNINWNCNVAGILFSNIINPPIISIIGNSNICNSEVKLVSNYANNNTWYPGEENTQTIIVNNGGFYCVKVTQNGCTVSSEYAKIVECPTVEKFTINNDARRTSIPDVVLYPVVLNSPEFYMASESPEFEDAKWIKYENNVPFRLSDGFGYKTVYYITKNDGGESNISYDDIYYYSYDNKDSLISKDDNKIILYPNPIINNLKIYSDKSIKNITIHNIYNEMITNAIFNDKNIEIDFSNIKKGIYFLILNFDDSSNQYYKVIKN